jgi:nucleotide-binding universal stress UspA family protein
MLRGTFAQTQNTMKSILVGTDYTPAGNRAVRYAAELAFNNKARLIVVHATQLMLVTESPLDLRYIMEEMEQADNKKMSALAMTLQKKYDNRLKLLTVVETGFVREIMRKKMHEYHPDLIVMGMPQVDFFSKKIFGSTSVHVLAVTNAPVLIIPEKARYKPVRKLVLAADGQTIQSKQGKAFLTEWLEKSKAQLSYLHIKDDLYPGTLGAYWKNMHKQFGTGESDVHVLGAISGQTAEQIHQWAKKEKADWIIAIARERNLFWRIIHESISKKLAYLSPMPILIIHDK